jgi:hypothetical protein
MALDSGSSLSIKGIFEDEPEFILALPDDIETKVIPELLKLTQQTGYLPLFSAQPSHETYRLR